MSKSMTGLKKKSTKKTSMTPKKNKKAKKNQKAKNNQVTKNNQAAKNNQATKKNQVTKNKPLRITKQESVAAKSNPVCEVSSGDGLNWPHVREVLYRPERKSYMVGKANEQGCVFCKSLNSGIGFESLMLAQTPASFVVLNKYPYNSGHLLILPKEHVGDMGALDQDSYYDLMDLLRKSVAAVQNVYQKPPHAVNVGLNIGKASGAGLPGHLHYHVIPRWIGDSNFFPLIAGSKVLPETLEQSYERLLGYFNE